MSSPKREAGDSVPTSLKSGGAEMEPAAASPPPSKPDADSDSKKRKDVDGGDAEMRDESKEAYRAEEMKEEMKEDKKEGEAEERPKPEKRRRIDDGKRSARMFGNILGTLRKFQDDEGKTKKSEAAQRRAATQSRIAARLQTDAIQSSALLAAERELRTVQTALASDTFLDRQLAAEARHALLESAKGYLSTTPSPPLSRAGLGVSAPRHPSRNAAQPDQLFPGDLLPGASVATAKGLSALYFLPKVLLPEQEDILRGQERDVADLIQKEKEQIEGERERHAETRAAQEKKLRELRQRVDELRAQEKEKHAQQGQEMDVEA